MGFDDGDALGGWERCRGIGEQLHSLLRALRLPLAALDGGKDGSASLLQVGVEWSRTKVGGCGETTAKCGSQ